MLATGVGRGQTSLHSSISKFVKTYLSSQIHLEVTTFHTGKENHIQNVICPAVIVILFLKSKLLTARAKFEGQYFSNQRCEIVKKLFSATTLCILFR